MPSHTVIYSCSSFLEGTLGCYDVTMYRTLPRETGLLYLVIRQNKYFKIMHRGKRAGAYGAEAGRTDPWDLRDCHVNCCKARTGSQDG